MVYPDVFLMLAKRVFLGWKVIRKVVWKVTYKTKC